MKHMSHRSFVECTTSRNKCWKFLFSKVTNRFSVYTLTLSRILYKVPPTWSTFEGEEPSLSSGFSAFFPASGTRVSVRSLACTVLSRRPVTGSVRSLASRRRASAQRRTTAKKSNSMVTVTCTRALNYHPFSLQTKLQNHSIVRTS